MKYSRLEYRSLSLSLSLSLSRNAIILKFHIVHAKGNVSINIYEKGGQGSMILGSPLSPFMKGKRSKLNKT